MAILVALQGSGPGGEFSTVSASLPRIFLGLFVINLGVAFGAGLYEGRIVLSQWLSAAGDVVLHWNAEATRRDNTGLRFWVFVTTVPLTLLTLGNLGYETGVSLSQLERGEQLRANSANRRKAHRLRARGGLSSSS